MNSSLTPRQWSLYNYLKKQDSWTTQYQVAFDLPQYYPLSVADYTDFHNSNARKDMTDDIRAINKSNIIQKIIITSSKGIKLANEAEAERYIKSKYAAIFRQLERARKIERKAGLDGQLKLVFGAEREIVQAFTDSNATGERWRLMRKLAGLSQKQAVEKFKQYINLDEPLLSRIETGVCLPTAAQVEAFEEVYR